MPAPHNQHTMLLSVLIPCLNEDKTIGDCIQKARAAIEKLKIAAEIVVIDNGSSDTSAAIASSLGARVVYEPKRGYGNAYKKGFAEARGTYIVMGDADDTYDFLDIEKFLQPLIEGKADFVMGSRFKGSIYRGAMPWANRYIGNPLLTSFINFLFHAKLSDAQCGMRAISSEAYRKLHLLTSGMEFASEMIVSALRKNLRIAEVAIHYYPRKAESKLHPLQDGWRHIRFMLLFSPTHLFLIPGLCMFMAGMSILTMMLFTSFTIAGHKWDIHCMVVSSFITILGFQILNLGFYAKTFSLTQGYVEQDRSLELMWRFFNLEKALAIGIAMFLVGLFFNIFIFVKWIELGFGPLNEMRKALFALTLMVIGAQTLFSAFFLSMLGIKKNGQK